MEYRSFDAKLTVVASNSRAISHNIAGLSQSVRGLVSACVLAIISGIDVNLGLRWQLSGVLCLVCGVIVSRYVQTFAIQ